jgi:hypothetical protein
MKGKIGLVVGLGAGYVLGTRAGRERYEQIKTQWLKLWHADPVQRQVVKAQDYAKAQVSAVPSALIRGAIGLVARVSDPNVPAQSPAVPRSARMSRSTAATQSTAASQSTPATQSGGTGHGTSASGYPAGDTGSATAPVDDGDRDGSAPKKKTSGE